MPHLPRLVARSLALLGVTLALGVLAGPAHAGDPVTGLFSFGVGGGPTSTSGDASKAFNNGYNARAFARLNIPAFPIDPRVDLMYQRHDMDDPSYATDAFTGGNPYGAGHLEAMSLLIEGQLSILPLGPVQAYIIAGAGWGSYKVSLEDGPGGAKTDDKASVFTYDAGLGVSVGLGPLRAFAEGRMVRYENDNELVDLGSTGLVPLTFGLLF